MKNDLKVGISVLFLNMEANSGNNTYPPQVDVSASKNRRTGIQKGVPVPSVLQSIARVSLLRSLIASHLSTISSLRHYLIDRLYILILRFSKKLAVFFEMRQFVWRKYAGNNDIQTYALAADSVTGNGQGEPVFEGGQKKGGNRPPPERPDTSKREKPGREGDKGSQRVRRQKKEEQQQT
jgi:hypothetical protein